MLNVKTPDEVLALIKKEFSPIGLNETVNIENALGRILSEDICSSEYVPGFDRSSVDGYAIRAKDAFGCSESIPAILKLCGKVEMGKDFETELLPGTCAEVPTGGKVPKGADCVVMVEYTEKFSSDEIAIIKSAAPGENMVYMGDDCRPGTVIAKKGTILKPQHIAVFASLGIDKVSVSSKLTVGIISTGDELVAIEDKPLEGQVRDVNSYMLNALCTEWGCKPVMYGFFKDDEELLSKAIKKAVSECDMVVISGGSSVGQKDATARIIESFGPLLFHGIAMKPGKPTILGRCGNKPLIGLPGHPGASFFVSSIFVKAIISVLFGSDKKEWLIPAILDEAVPANQGRTVYIGVSLEERDGKVYAVPVQSKSGLISSLTRSDGFLTVSRDAEGISKGSLVNILLF